MAPDFASKIQPYVSYIWIAQAVLLSLAVVIGCVILIRSRMRASPFEGVAGIDHERIAGEITQEIQRLRQLRQRIFPSGADDMQEPAIAAPTGEPAVASATATAPDVDIAAIEARVRKEYEEKVTQLQARIQDLEATATSQSSINPDSLDAISVSDSSNPSASSGASNADVDELKKAFETEKATLRSQIGHLEKVLSEYQVFEDDFAMARRFKAENEQLRKQLAETHNITEEDIANLFQSANPGAPSAAAASPAPTGDLFDASDLENFAAAATADDGKKTFAADAAPATEKKVISGDSPGADDLDQLFKASAEPAPSSEESAEDLLAAMMAASPAAPEPSPLIETASASTPAPAKNYETEKTTEPDMARRVPEQSLEDLAESAVNDDDLIAEFQKILGDQQS